MIGFVTFFNKKYLLAGLTLVDSIVAQMPESKIYVMPLDIQSTQICSEKFISTENVVVLDNTEILTKIQYFASKGRSLPEAIFSVKPEIILKAFSKISEDDLLIYCDADIFFFSNLKLEISKRLGLVVSKHIFSKTLAHHKEYGEYNAGLVGFKKNSIGLGILKEWIELCHEKCSLVPSEDHFADQKYLGRLFAENPSSLCLERYGVNQSLWALSDNSSIRQNSINGDPLVCFHFHGFKSFRNVYFTDLDRYGRMKTRKEIWKQIYLPYVQALNANLGRCLEVLERQPIREFNFKRIADYNRWSNLDNQ